jgi:hypothetical protein
LLNLNRWRVELGLLPDTSLIFIWVLNKELICFSLCWVCWIWSIKELLDAHQNLFHCYCRSPTRVFIEDGEAYCARGINIRVKKACWKFALGWFTRIIFTEMNGDWKIATFPISPSFPRQSALPNHQIQYPIYT